MVSHFKLSNIKSRFGDQKHTQNTNYIFCRSQYKRAIDLIRVTQEIGFVIVFKSCQVLKVIYKTLFWPLYIIYYTFNTRNFYWFLS